MRWVLVAPLLAAVLIAFAVPAAAHAGVYARVTGDEVVLGNDVAERRWARDGLVTTALVDKRGADTLWSAGRRDFALDIAGRAELGSERFTVVSAETRQLVRGGLRVVMQLTS